MRENSTDLPTSSPRFEALLALANKECEVMQKTSTESHHRTSNEELIQIASRIEESEKKALAAEAAGKEEEVQKHFHEAIALATQLQALLEKRVFPSSTLAIPKGQRTTVTDRPHFIQAYVQCGLKLSSLQIKLGHYEAAEPNIKELLQFSKHSILPMDELYFDLGLISQAKFKKNESLSDLWESSNYFIRGLMEARKINSPKITEITAKLIENTELIAKHQNRNQNFAFSSLPEYEQSLLKAIVSTVLNANQLSLWSSSGDESLGFFVANKWQQPFSDIGDFSPEQIEAIKQLQNTWIPKPNEKEQSEPSQVENNLLINPQPMWSQTMRSEKSTGSYPQEKLNAAFRKAFAEFEKHYPKTEIKRFPYEPFEAGARANTLKRVLYILPSEGDDPETFAQATHAFLTSENAEKGNAKRVDVKHMATKKSSQKWARLFEVWPTPSKNKKPKQVWATVNFADKPEGTVAVVLKSAAYAYHLLKDKVDYVSEKNTSDKKAPAPQAPRPQRALEAKRPAAPSKTTRVKTTSYNARSRKVETLYESSSESSVPRRKRSPEALSAEDFTPSNTNAPKASPEEKEKNAEGKRPRDEAVDTPIQDEKIIVKLRKNHNPAKSPEAPQDPTSSEDPISRSSSQLALRNIGLFSPSSTKASLVERKKALDEAMERAKQKRIEAVKEADALAPESADLDKKIELLLAKKAQKLQELEKSAKAELERLAELEAKRQLLKELEDECASSEGPKLN